MRKHLMRSSVEKDLQQKLKKDPLFHEYHKVEKVKADLVIPIVKERMKKGWSQTELAKRVKVSQQQISKIENLDFSEFNTVLKVLHALGYTISASKKPHRARAA